MIIFTVDKPQLLLKIALDMVLLSATLDKLSISLFLINAPVLERQTWHASRLTMSAKSLNFKLFDQSYLVKYAC